MKLFLFVSQLSAGGAEQVAALLAQGFTNLHCETTIVAASLQGEFIERINPKCKTIDLKSKKPIKSLRVLANLVKTTKPDAIICFGITTGIAATLSKFIFRWKSRIIIRNENNLVYEWSEASLLNRLIGPPLSRWATHRGHVIAVSHSLAKATAEYLRLPSQRVATILNPVLTNMDIKNAAQTSVLHSWLQDEKTPTFVAVGRLEHQKGFDVLIDAFSKLHNAEARLLIFGKGTLRDTLQHQIEQLGLHDKVALVGFTNSPIAQMQAAHAFVLSSRFEGFGLVLVEALWAGAQVISTDCDFGPSELLEKGRYGTLVPVNDVEALACALRASLEKPPIIERPSEAWFSQFMAEEAALQHLSLIESLCNHHSTDNAYKGTIDR